MTPDQLKQARQSLGLSQANLAEILGFERAHISRMENGREPIKTATALAVMAMAAFGMPDQWPASGA